MSQHILFDMDKELKKRLLQLVEYELLNYNNSKNGKGYVRSNVLLSEKEEWIGGLYHLRNRYHSLAEPDAVPLISVFQAVFDEVKTHIEKMPLTQNQRDQLLFALSRERKLFDIDKKSGGIYNTARPGELIKQTIKPGAADHER